MRSMTRVIAAFAVLAALGLMAAGCGSGSSSSSGGKKAEVVITCESCVVTAAKDDTFAQFYKQLTAAFNAKYKGRYHVKVTPFKPANDADAAQHYQREGATGTLPDLFTEQSNVIQSVARTGGLTDLAPYLSKDPAWKDSFVPNAFVSQTDAQGHIWGVPEQSDTIGIFYNKALFQKAGIAAFPTTWDELLTACTKLKASGVIPFAMDGDWVTQLMWSNLIGTQPGGAAFLQAGIAKGGLADNPTVVKATEYLKQMHTSGCVNKDAFTGDYNRAAAPFLAGQAAMVANGPWMAADIANAKLKLKDIGYVPSPGSGLIVVTGSAGWASGAKDAAHREAAVAFLKFLTSSSEMYRKALMTGSYWPIKEQLTAAQVKQLEPLSYNLIQQAKNVTYTYPNSKFATPEAFSSTWINDWPAYVQGGMSTASFLNALSDTLR
ncbi:MAG TPA: extracellular solute-binding protein [Conexibacter sp.]|nr:extracellular solute-binding protein [Conexibacter sp.]